MDEGPDVGETLIKIFQELGERDYILNWWKKVEIKQETLTLYYRDCLSDLFSKECPKKIMAILFKP